MEEGVDLQKDRDGHSIMQEFRQVGNTSKCPLRAVTLRTVSQPKFLTCHVKVQRYLREG